MGRVKFFASRYLIAAALLCGVTPASAQRPIRINMGTVAPEGSPWHEVLQRMGQDWRRISGGKINFRIFPGGVLGSEAEMLRKMRIGQLQAVGLSGAGLERVDSGVACLQIPMMIDSYEELDYIREKIAPKLEVLLEQKGYIVLNWSDVGWVHFFTKQPARTPDDIRKMKLFTSAGDPETEKLYKEFGFRPVPLDLTDMLLGLQTGMIDAFDVPPLFAMLDQTFGLAKNMIDVKWAPLVSATIISRRTWQRIPPEWRAEMHRSARKAGLDLRGKIRKLGDDAVVEMQKRGLKVVRVDKMGIELWRSEAEAAYPQLRGRLVPEDLFDEVLRLRNEFRASQGRGSRGAATSGRRVGIDRREMFRDELQRRPFRKTP